MKTETQIKTSRNISEEHVHNEQLWTFFRNTTKHMITVKLSQFVIYRAIGRNIK